MRQIQNFNGTLMVINNKYAEYKVTPVPIKPPIKSPYVPKTSFSILDQVNILP